MLFFFQAGLEEGPNLPAGGSKLTEIGEELSLSRWTLDSVYNCFSVNVCTLSLMMFLFILSRQGFIFYWVRLYFICFSGSVRIDSSWGGLCSIIFPCLWSSEAVTKIYFESDIWYRQKFKVCRVMWQDYWWCEDGARPANTDA